MQHTIIDRFEGDFAICETEDAMIKIIRTELPAGISEGDLIYYSMGEWVVDHDATVARRKAILEKRRRLTER